MRGRNPITGCNDRVHISTVQRVGRYKTRPTFFRLATDQQQSGSKNPNKKPEIKIPGLIRFQNQLGLIKKGRKRLQKYIFVE